MDKPNNLIFSLYEDKVKAKLINFNQKRKILSKVWFTISLAPLTVFYSNMLMIFNQHNHLLHYLPLMSGIFSLSYATFSIKYIQKKHKEFEYIYDAYFSNPDYFDEQYKIYLIEQLYMLNHNDSCFQEVYTQTQYINMQLLFDRAKKEKQLIDKKDFMSFCNSIYKIEHFIPKYLHLSISQLEHIILSIIENSLKIDDDYFLFLREHEIKNKHYKKLNQSL